MEPAVILQVNPSETMPHIKGCLKVEYFDIQNTGKFSDEKESLLFFIHTCVDLIKIYP